MTALDKNPLNKNYLSPLTFQFALRRAPHINFTVQNAVLPGIMLDPVETQNPFVTIPYAGDHVYYEELTLQFIVDEDLNNWLEMHNWIRALGFPKNWPEYKALSDEPWYSDVGVKSDASLLIANSSKNLNIEVTFKDAFPIALSNLQFDVTQPDIDYLHSFVTFRYTLYDIKKLPTA